MTDTNSTGPSLPARVDYFDRASVEDSPVAVMTPFVVLASLAIAGLFLFSQLSRHFFFAELFCNFQWQMMVLMLPFPFLLYYLNRKVLALVMGVIVVWCTAGIMSVYLPASQPPPGMTTAKILSFNVLGLNEDHDKVCEVIRSEDADVLVVIEYSNAWVNVLSQFEEKYPYRLLEPRWHGYGIGLFSKLPLVETRVHQLTNDKTDNPALIAQVEMGTESFQLACIHVFSPTNSFRMNLRNEQLEEMANLLGASDEPTVVVGDFNSAPWSPFMIDFIETTKTRDSRQGFGFHASWPTFLWAIRVPIDHAFVTENIHVHQRRIGKDAGSDHLPLVFEVSVSGEKD